MLHLIKTPLFLLLAAATVIAQAPAPPRPVPPIPLPLPIPDPAAAPAIPAPVAPPAVPGGPAGEPTVPLQFLDLDVKDVLNYYERWTGRRLVYSTQLVGPIRMFVSGQVPQSEAVKLVEMALNINGFYIVPTEDPKIWKVTGIGMNPKQVGIPFVDREELLPAGEQMVMFLFKLNWADPTELAATIGQGILVPNQSGATSVVPLPKAQALLVTENTNIIRMLIKVVRAIDVEPSEVVSEFITLQHAQAEEVATDLEKLFEKQQQQGAAPGVPGVPKVQRIDPSGNPLPPGVAPADGRQSIVINGGTGTGPTEDNIVIGKVRITADKRTNRLHVVSRPVNLKLIRALIKEYDSHVPLEVPAVRPLRFRPVEEVIDAVVAAVKDPGEKNGGGAGDASGSRPPGAPGGTSQTQRPATQNQGGLAGGRGGGFGSGAGGFGDSGTGSLGESLSTTERDTQPTTQQVGKSTIIADKRANSIIVVGPRDVTEKIFALIDKLDVRQEQVMIHCVIGELRLTGKEQFGLEYILRNGGVIPGATTTNSVTGTGGNGTGTGTVTATSGTTPVGFDSNGQAILNLNSLLTGTSGNTVTNAAAIGAGGFSGIVAAGTAFNAVLKTLESSNRFRVVTRPSIFTSNNKRAVITSGEEIPVPANIQSTFNPNGGVNNPNSFATNSSIQFKPVEIRLEVLPLINSNKEVSLEIVQNISDVSGATRIDGNDIINVSRRALKTYVTVPNNGTLILGGLIKDSKDNTRSGPLMLSRIPLIGPLFGSRSTDKVRTELIVLMRPVVTTSPSETASLREKTFESFNIPPDLESAGMPQGIRDQIKAPKPSSLRSSAPKLREESGGQRKR